MHIMVAMTFTLRRTIFLICAMMAKIFPQTYMYPSSLQRETFTIWLKSLLLNGNGCTVYNANGQIIYRVDNYDSKSSDEVYLMDLRGNVMCSIVRKKFQLFGCWSGYKCDSAEMKNEKPWFQIRKKSSTSKGCIAYQAIVGSHEAEEKIYKIEGEHMNKQSFKIVDHEQKIVAEVTQKQSSGVALGNDVLSIVIEPDVDLTLVIALVTFYGLRSKKTRGWKPNI